MNSSPGSIAWRLASLSPEQRRKEIQRLSRDQARALLYDWKGFWARPNQLAPLGGWSTWLILAGRGFGKTRTGAEWVRERVESGKAKRIALVARTAADARDVIVEGESGILAICPPWNRPKYEPSKRRLTWPNGAMATLYSAEEPNLLRGPQHDTAWGDELSSWRDGAAWSNLELGLRLGDDPRVVVTTTPRPIKIIRRLLKEETTSTTRGSTFDNAANLPPKFLTKILRKYQGTRLGRQELFADVLDDAPGALWRRADIDRLRVAKAPNLRLIVIGVDPAVTTGEGANETGIVVFGIGEDGHGYVLEDLSGKYTPHEWGTTVVQAYFKWKANRVVAEVNQGGDLVKSNIRTVANAKHVTVSVRTVHAAKAKRTRAEPVAALYEQERVHHVFREQTFDVPTPDEAASSGCFSELEDQMCTWQPDLVEGDEDDEMGTKKRVVKSDSPDRLDALVWAATDTMVDRNPSAGRRGGTVGSLPTWEDRPLGD